MSPPKSAMASCPTSRFLKTTDEIFQDPKDGWTLRASDGSRGAHSEHTIAITENGPIVFTDRTNL